MGFKKLVLDNLVQGVAGMLVAIAVPLAVQFPDAAPYITVVAGGITFIVGNIYPGWKTGWFSLVPKNK